MLDYVEKMDRPVHYVNCHSVCIIDKQAMKCRHHPLSLLLDLIPAKIESGELRDVDLLYVVPVGKEYHTEPFHRIKNDKFTATVNDGETILTKRGSIRPLMKWLKEAVNKVVLSGIQPKVTVTRVLGKMQA